MFPFPFPGREIDQVSKQMSVPGVRKNWGKVMEGLAGRGRGRGGKDACYVG